MVAASSSSGISLILAVVAVGCFCFPRKGFLHWLDLCPGLRHLKQRLFSKHLCVVIPVVLEGNEWVISSLGDFVGPFPNLFEMKGLLVPFFHGGWDDVHGINSSHKLGRDSSGKEIDQDIFVGDSAKGSIVFKFQDVVENVEFVVDLGGG